MKLSTFSTAAASHHVGAVIGDEIADLSAVDGGPASVVELLARPSWRTEVDALHKNAPHHPVTEVKLHAPVPVPSKYFAIGLNSRDHRSDINARWLIREPKLIRIAMGYLLAHPRPKQPFFFAKATSAIVGPTDPIVLPQRGDQVDWEGELAVVVGCALHEATVEDARRAIAGYLVANDVSVRDWQTDNPTASALAKSYPTHGPLGPWLTTPDEIDLDAAQLRTYLNGELRQHGRISELIYSPAEILSRLSTFCMLQPGDIIACGTFAGTGWPTGRFLRPGDLVRVEIDDLGALDNPVIAHNTSELTRL